MQWKYIWWMLMVLLLRGHFYTDADGTVRVPSEGSALEWMQLDNTGNTPELQMTDHMALVSRSGEVTGTMSRIKRGILFPSGVQICSQETVKQAVQIHLDYFHLRVCQETVWEAFKVFWDRLPKRDEYQLWISRCQNSNDGVSGIGRSFSQSPEHLELITSRMQVALVIGQQTKADATKMDIISTTDEVASVTSLLAEVNPAEFTDPKTALTLREVLVTTEEPAVSQKQVMVTTDQFTDSPLKLSVTTRQSMVTPNVEMVTTVESFYSPAGAILTTKQSIDIATKAVATEQPSTNTPSDTIIMPTEPVSLDTTTQNIFTTGQYMYIPAETEEHPKNIPIGAMATTKVFTDTATNITTTDQSMDTPKDTAPPFKVSAMSSDIATEVTAKQFDVTLNKAIISAHLLPVSSIATELEFTVEGSADPGLDLLTGNSQQVNPDSMTIVTNLTSEKLIPGALPGINHNTNEMPLGTTAVAFESDADDPVEVSVNSGLGENIIEQIETDEKLLKEALQIDNGGVGAPVELLPRPTLRTTLEPTKDEQPDIETIEITQPDNFVDTSLDEPLFSSSEDTHESDGYSSGSVILEEVSSTVKDLSAVTRIQHDTNVTIVQISNDEDARLETVGVREYRVSKENDTFARAEVEIEAHKNKLSLVDNTPVAEVQASASADVSFDNTVKDYPKDDAREKLDIILDETPVYIAEDVVTVDNIYEKQSENPVETAVHDASPKVIADIAVKNDSDNKVGASEVIPSTNGKDVTLAFTLHPSVLILDIEDLTPDVTPTTGDYKIETNIIEMNIKKETTEENLLESTIEGKMPGVFEDTTLTIPEMTVSEETNTPLVTIVPENTSRAVVFDDTTSELHEIVDRSTGTEKQDDTPAPSVGIEELTANMQRKTTSSTAYASTLSSNNIEDERNMNANEIAEIRLRPVHPIMNRVLELSIKLRGETYDDALRDPSSFYYRHLSEQFIEKIEDAYKKLPGFQRVFIRQFRPQKDIQGGLAVVAHYTIVLEGDVAGVNRETTSNEVEKSYTKLEELPTVVYTVTDLRHYITQALQKESLGNNGKTSLDMDPYSLQLENVDMLELSKPTSRRLNSSNMMDNVLAAEKPPSIPKPQFSTDVFISNENFLFDTVHPYHPLMGSQTEVASKNDILILEDKTEIPLDVAMDVERIPKINKTIRDPTLITTNDITIEEDELLEVTTTAKAIPAIVVEEIHPTGKDVALVVEESIKHKHKHTDIGSGFSSPDRLPNTWPWITDWNGGSLQKNFSKAEGDQEDHEKKKVEKEKKSEISVQQSTSKVPLLDVVLMTHHQDTTTEQVPVSFTMKTLMMELSMQIKISPVVSNDFSGELSSVAPVTEPSGQVHLISKSSAIEGSAAQSPEIKPKNGNTQGTTGHALPTSMLVQEVSNTGTMIETTTEKLQQYTKSPPVVVMKADTVEETSIVPETTGQPIIKNMTNLPEIFEFKISNDEMQIIEDVTFTVTQAPFLKFPDEDIAKDEIIMVTAKPVALVTEAPNGEVSTQHLTKSSFTRVFGHSITMVTKASLQHSPVIPSHTADLIIPDEMMSQAYGPSTADTTTQNHANGQTEMSTSNAKLSIASHVSTTERGLLSTTVHQTFRTTFQSTNRDLRDDHQPMNEIISTSSISDRISFYENKENDSSTAQSHIPHNPSISDLDVPFDVIQYDDNGSGFTHGNDVASVPIPATPGQALTVFFSLRVTNLIFSQDLFNKSSSEYKTLERQFLDLLVPYLQSNLSNFQHLEILNFRNGSIVVNSRMKFWKPVPHEVNSAVYLILENFCNTAYQTMNLAIDKYSLDVESGDKADPCKFQACNGFSKCTVSQWTGEAECVCDPGYFSMDGLPCRSVCDVKKDFCHNDGKCDIIPSKGAICRCRVGENWWYRGKHCEKYVSEPLVVGIAIVSVAGFLLVASGVMFFLTRKLRERYDKDDSEDPLRYEDVVPSLERSTGLNAMFVSDISSHSGRYRQTYFSTGHEMGNVYKNVQLMQEEIPDGVQIPELTFKVHRFADFAQQLRL